MSSKFYKQNTSLTDNIDFKYVKLMAYEIDGT